MTQIVLTSHKVDEGSLVYMNGHNVGSAYDNGHGQWYSTDRAGAIVSAGHASIHSAMLDLARHYITEEPK